MSGAEKSKDQEKPARLSAVYFSIYIFGIGMALSYFVHQQNIQEHEKSLHTENRLYANSIKTRLTQDLENRCLALELMARRWEAKDGTSQAEWELDARDYKEHLGGFKILEWVDETGQIRWIVPREGNEGKIGRDLSKEVGTREILEAARLGRRTQLACLRGTHMDCRDFYVFVPIVVKDKIAGFIVGELKFRQVFDQALASADSRFSVGVYERGQEVYRRVACSKDLEKKWGQRELLDSRGASWVVVVTPTEEMLRDSLSPFASMILPFGFLLSLVLGVATYFGQSSRLSFLELRSAQTELQSHRDRLEYLVEERTLELNRAYQASTESRAQLSAVLNSVVEGIVTMETDGTIVMANSEALKMWGYTEKDLIGQNITILVPESYRDAHESGMRRYLETGIPHFIGSVRELKSVRQDGSIFPMQICISETKIEGRLHFTAAVEDITERKRVEEELKVAKEEAEAANKAKTSFLAKMSHDLRTPISGVSGNIQLLRGTDLDEVQRGYALTVEASANALLEQINEVLDLSKIEAGQITFRSAPFNLLWVVERTVQLVSPRASARGVELIVQYDPAGPTHVVGDARRIRQILMNLLSNAVKFTSDGEVSVSVRVEAQGKAQAMFSFQVRDTGLGIPADQVSQIFDEYVQVGESEGGKYGGSGLGLTICKQLVEAMGGCITVQSEAGVGTTFHFCLPLRLNPHGRQAAGPSENLRGVRLLVADRSRATCEALREPAESWGFEVTCASTPEEFMQALTSSQERAAPIQVAVMGCRPDLAECREVAQQLSSDPATSDLILIAAVSAEKAIGIEELKEFGFRGYLSKPVQRAHFLNVLERCWAVRNGEEDSDFIIGHVSPEDERTHSEPAEEIPGAASSAILVVDDNDITRDIAVKMLERFGCTVQAVSSGNMAVQETQRNEYDLVLMDCMMPDMNGYEATRQIRSSDRDGRSVPIIAMTANAMPGDRERCLRAGMDDYVSKPLIFDDLHDVLEAWLPSEQREEDSALELEAEASKGAPTVELRSEGEAETKPVVPIEPDHSHGEAAIADAPTKELVAQAAPVLDWDISEPIDLDAYRHLQIIANGRVAFLRKLIDKYKEEGEKQAAAMSALIQKGDREALKAISHAFKGASAQMGAPRLRYLCQQLEKSAGNGDFGDSEKLAAEFREELTVFTDSFRSQFSGESLSLTPSGKAPPHEI